MRQLQQQCVAKLSKIKNLVMTKEDEDRYAQINRCHLCNKVMTSTDKVRDHDHITGLFRGGAHSVCNLKYKISVKT